MGYQFIDTEIVGDKEDALGVAMPFNAQGVFNRSYTTMEQAYTNIRSLLLTRTGERYEQPSLGTDLLYVIFQPNISDLKDQISDIIVDAVSFWLPYVDITKLEIITQEEDHSLIHTVKISISFTVNNIEPGSTITITADESGVVQVSK